MRWLVPILALLVLALLQETQGYTCNRRRCARPCNGDIDCVRSAVFRWVDDYRPIVTFPVCDCKCKFSVIPNCPGGGGWVSPLKRDWIDRDNRSLVAERNASPLTMTGTTSRFTVSASLEEEQVMAIIRPQGLEMVSGTLKYKGAGLARSQLGHFIADGGGDYRVLLVEDDSMADVTSLVRPANKEGDTSPVFYYEALVYTLDNYTGVDLMQLHTAEYSILSAPQASNAETLSHMHRDGQVLRRIEFEFNVYAITNAQIYHSLIAFQDDLDTGVLTPGLMEVTREAQKRWSLDKRQTTGDFVLELETVLSQEQLALATQSGVVTVNSISASSTGLSVGATVGVVLGSVGGFLLLVTAAAAVIVAGRTFVLKRNLAREKSPVELTPTAHHEDEVEIECDVAKPKFSIQVVGNTEFAGSLTMRNPQQL